MEIDSDFVIEQLEKVCLDVKIYNNDIAIVCPFHADSKPSCMVHTSGHKFKVGVYHCWSCNASGNWQKLATKLGLESGSEYTIKNPFSAKGRALKKILAAEQNKSSAQIDHFIPRGSVPWTSGGFRGIPEDFLVKLKAQEYYDIKNSVKRIVFPVLDKRGITIGSVGRRLDKSKFLPWLNSSGKWARQALFPLHLMCKPLNKVVLVEGPFDAIRLNYVGIPALSILGASNWSALKKSTLEGMGVKNIIICMDGDAAGRHCEKEIFENTKGSFKRKRFHIPIEDPALDPGNMPQSLVDELRDFGNF